MTEKGKGYCKVQSVGGVGGAASPLTSSRQSAGTASTEKVDPADGSSPGSAGRRSALRGTSIQRASSTVSFATDMPEIHEVPSYRTYRDQLPDYAHEDDDGCLCEDDCDCGRGCRCVVQ
ncbi:unnamed protein product [Prorocentrum cordatum]|uniref:Pre-SET domain-containing protein n=1 Tax=Prorocentrum cordatum TaxID=2364126 RepID=A0ABN9UCC7_9DINO|nr:unnamed protein product [Polarella glacialis]|mmetsp:Transcript_7624/g.20430  ORF Transcript_7624/g.20430 Transcript_7624/m.20430 type:complete len:119 (-) Transcript_7624:211-567(-)